MSKPLIFEYLSVTRQKIWSNDFSNAQNYLQKADTLITTAYLSSDSTVKSDFLNTKATLQTQYCIYLNNNYNDYFEKYKSAKNQRRFNEAAQCIDSMAVIAKSNSICDIKDNLLPDEKKSVKLANSYQQMIQDSRYLITIKKVDEALKLFFKADSVYSSNLLQNLSLSRDSITSLFIFSTDYSLYGVACELLCKMNKYREVVPVLRLMKQKGISAKEAKTWQIIVGKELFKQDILLHPEKSKKELLNTYQFESSWYYQFKRSYLKNPITALF
jgi:hypothetical protein